MSIFSFISLFQKSLDITSVSAVSEPRSFWRDSRKPSSKNILIKRIIKIKWLQLWIFQVVSGVSIPEDLSTILGMTPSDIDKYSRIFFPITFTCFQLMYWIIYNHLSDDETLDGLIFFTGK